MLGHRGCTLQLYIWHPAEQFWTSSTLTPPPDLFPHPMLALESLQAPVLLALQTAPTPSLKEDRFPGDRREGFRTLRTATTSLMHTGWEEAHRILHKSRSEARQLATMEQPRSILTLRRKGLDTSRKGRKQELGGGQPVPLLVKLLYPTSPLLDVPSFACSGKGSREKVDRSQSLLE